MSLLNISSTLPVYNSSLHLGIPHRTFNIKHPLQSFRYPLRWPILGRPISLLNKGERGDFVLKAFNENSINENRNISEKCSKKEVPWNNVVCMENCSQNLWKILVRKFTTKITSDAAFLRTNSFTSVFERAWLTTVPTGCFYEHLLLQLTCSL